MTLNSLFDKKRVKELRNAVKRGEKDILKKGRKQGARLPEPSAERAEKADERRIILDGQTVLIGSSEKMFVAETLSPTSLLYKAIREGDLKGVQRAVDAGADLKAERGILPEDYDVEDTMVSVPKTPLEFARSLGHIDIARFLESRGASR
jgi:hypothetical protein